MKKMMVFFLLFVLLLGAQESNSNMCYVDIKITGDFPAGKLVEPEIVTLNGKSVDQYRYFAPGTYRLVVKEDGYEPINESFTIPPKAKTIELKHVLVTKPRSYFDKTKFDVQPMKKNWPRKITVKSLTQPQKAYVIKNGEMLKPGSYFFTITSKGYYPIFMKRYVWPSDSVYNLSELLIASPVMIKIQDKDLQFFLIDLNTNTSHFLIDGIRVKPGSYALKCQSKEGEHIFQKYIKIFPSEKPYVLTKSPNSIYNTGRTLAFQFFHKKELILAKSITINGENFTFGKKFKEGSNLRLTALFGQYKTIKASIKIPKGSGIVVYKQALTPLVSSHFTMRNRAIVLDNLTYKYEFYTNKRRIENHLIHVEKGRGRYYFSVWAQKHLKSVQVYAGYYWGSLGRRMPKFKSQRIDGNRLLKHLLIKWRMSGASSALKALENAMNNEACFQYVQPQMKKRISLFLKRVTRKKPGLEKYKQKLLRKLIQK